MNVQIKLDVPFTMHTLPTKFKFRYYKKEENIVYSAEIVENHLSLHWQSYSGEDNNDTSYTLVNAIRYLNEGTWIIVEEEKQFTVDDLKVNQRVVTRNGKNAIVFEHSYNGKIGKYIAYINSEGKQAGFDRAQFDHNNYAIVEVYEQPDSGSCVYHLKDKGQLVYSEASAKAHKARAIEEARAKLVQATEAYEQAKKELRELAFD